MSLLKQKALQFIKNDKQESTNKLINEIQNDLDAKIESIQNHYSPTLDAIHIESIVETNNKFSLDIIEPRICDKYVSNGFKCTVVKKEIQDGIRMCLSFLALLFCGRRQDYPPTENNLQPKFHHHKE